MFFAELSGLSRHQNIYLFTSKSSGLNLLVQSYTVFAVAGCRAFGWKAPKFAHLPLIVNSDGTKLSKRQDDIRLEHFRSNGFYPEAVTSLLCLAGGGFSSNDIQNQLVPISELSKMVSQSNDFTLDILLN